jgi:DNA-binding CsgD family transcriptional regulator
MLRPVANTLSALLWLFCSFTATANPFLEELERATPAKRVILVLNYFDTCKAVAQDQVYTFRLLDGVRQVGKKTRDGQLQRYCQYLKNTWPKNRNRSHAGNAALFLSVGAEAGQNNDPQIAAVCRHFAGQYYFLDGEYGKAFEHLLAANKAFREIGYRNIPEISRYLYELAFNYYYFQEYEKVIQLLTEAALYPVFSDNLAIQTYNTMGMAYTSRLHAMHNPKDGEKAERNYLKAREVAARHGDSLWIGISTGNLADLYIQQQQWDTALAALQIDYAIGLRFGNARSLPDQTALKLADIYWQRRQMDSCFYFLRQSMELYRRNLADPYFGQNLRNEYFLKGYYDVGRRYYRAVNDFPKAYAFSDSLSLLSERIHKRYNSRQMSLAEQKLLIQKHQLEVAAIEKEKKAQRRLFWTGSGTLAMVALLFFRLYRLGRLRRQQEGEINAEKEKSMHLEKRLVEEELQRARTDLEVFVDNLHEKNALIDAITIQLEHLSRPQPRDSEPQLLEEARQKLINAILLTNEDWEEFRQRFERVHPGFLRQLKTLFSDLSPAEERLLALSKLDLDTRQMSRVLGIAPESIRKTRYRLRKRLGIDGASSLSDLLGESAGRP